MRLLPRSATRRFRGKTALITGGGSGIGFAIGEHLVQLGADVTLADLDGSAQVAAATITSRDSSGSVRGIDLDVRERDEVEAAVSALWASNGSIDLLFNNAGLSLGGPTDELSGAHWDRIIDVNLRGVVHGVEAAYPRMAERGSGHIVNTASAAGLVAAPFAAAYSTTKHAVVGLSHALRPEAAAHGVKVTVLCPGVVETPMLDAPPPEDLPSRPESLTGRDYFETMGVGGISADVLAERALRGVARNRATIVTPANVKAAWYLHRWSPALTGGIHKLTVSKVGGELERRRSR